MEINRYVLYDKKFEKFLKFWDNEVEKKFLRCSKEYGVYNQIKKTLNPSNKVDWDANLYGIYNSLLKNLLSNINSAIDFSGDNDEHFLLTRKYCVKTALSSNRHLSQLMVFSILQKSMITDSKFCQVFKAMDKELFKGHRFSAFFIEKWNLLKIFFK